MANVIKHKRGSGSDPVASDLVVGEVAIRTDTGKLFTKMDNGSVAEIAGGGSDIAINTLSASSGTGGGSATFNGSAYRFTLSAPPSVSAQQLLVSINGVIQKPVAGTGQPSQGFSVDGTDIILGDAPATGSDFFILTFKSLGVSEPADNSVTSAKIVDGAIVNADINASAAIAGTKISPDFGSQTITTTGNITTTGDLTVGGTYPAINLYDSNNNPDWRIQNNNGMFAIFDQTNGANRVQINTDGHIDLLANVDISNGLDVTGAITGTGDLTIDTNTLHVDSTNNRVGIGTTSPATLLNLNVDTEANLGSGSEGIRLTSGSSNAQFVRLGSSYSNGSVTGPGALLYSSNKLSIRCDNGNPITFHTGSTVAERMRIDSSGNVSIGNSSPESDNSHHLLTLAGKASNGAGGISFVDTSSNVDAFIFADTGSLFLSADYDNATADSSIRFRVDGSSEKMRIDSSGRIGIGTTLQSDTTSSGAGLKIETYLHHNASYYAPEGYYAASLGEVQNTENKVWIAVNSHYARSSAVSAGLFLSAFHQDAGGSGCGSTIKNLKTGNALTFSTVATGASVGNPAVETERMRITSSGQVGIGVTPDTWSTGAGITVGTSQGTLWGAGDQINLSGNAYFNSGWKAAASKAGASQIEQALGNIDFKVSGSVTADSAITFTNAMRITSSGNVSIGSTSNVAPLNVRGMTDGNLHVRPITSIHSGTGVGLDVLNDANNAVKDLAIRAATTVFKNASAETIRIDSSGHFLFNCTSLPSSSNAGAAIERNGGTGVFRFSSGSTTASSNAFEFINANGFIGTINLNGSTTSYNSLSDYRLKENVVAISDGITRLKTLKPYRFNFKADADTTVDGFFAHEVTAVPEAITGTKDEVDSDNNPVYQSIDQSKLVPLLVAALQEAVARIEVLEAK